jgi:hypothetical protein
VNTGDYFGNSICGSGTGDVRIETRMLLIAIVLVAALVTLVLVLWRLERRQEEGKQDQSWIVQLLAPVGLAGVLLWWFGQYGPRDVIFQAALPSDGIALVLLPILAVLAFVVLTAVNPRRFVLGACAFAIIAFLVLYPNLSALPLPNKIVSAYNALLPTWFYGFQFSVNLQQAASVQVIGAWSIMLIMLTLLGAGFVAWAAWERRIVIGYRRARRLSDAAEASDTTDGRGPGGTAASAESAPSAASAPSAGPATERVPPRRSRKDKPTD